MSNRNTKIKSNKSKSEFHDLIFINPFDIKYVRTMVDPTWSDRDTLSKWREDNSSFLPDKKLLDLLDVDELTKQWDVYPSDRRVNPKNCLMLFKELCIVLRMIDAEHQDAIFQPGNPVPGVVYSKSKKKYMYRHYLLDSSDAKAPTKVLLFDTEEEAFDSYKENRDELIRSTASAALNYKLISPRVFMEYFNNADIRPHVRSYEYYKNQEYLKEKDK